MKKVIVVIGALLSLLMVATQSNGRMNVTPSGVTFPDATTQTSAAASTMNVVCMPTWHQILPVADRFILVMNDEAVLDKETGLVWERTASSSTKKWSSAVADCYSKFIGDRYGWRLPTIEELMSLLSFEGVAGLPTGHPFLGQLVGVFWSSTTSTSSTLTNHAYAVQFGWLPILTWDKDNSGYVRAVRGGHGHDAR